MMIHKFLISAAVLATLSVPALSQQNPPPPAPPGDQADAPPPPGADAPPPPPGKGPPPPPPHGPRGPMGMPPPPPPPHASLDLHLGGDISMRVDCGTESIKVCLDAFVPVLDKVGAMMAGAQDDSGSPPTDDERLPSTP